MAGKETERTLVIVKPDGVEKGLLEGIIARVRELDLMVGQIQTRKLSSEECQKLYPKTRKNLPEIYVAVERHMTESFSIIFIAEGEDAVAKVRGIRGPTDLLQAPEGTVRRDFITEEERELFKQGKNVRNVMHAPDDKEEAEFEIELLFGKMGE